MSYCQICGYDDQAAEGMDNVPCQRCGATKHLDGSASYDESEDMQQRIEEFDNQEED